MIPRFNKRGLYAAEHLSAALGRPVSDREGLTEHTVVAHWPGLDLYTLNDEQKIWTSAEWAEHLDDPTLEAPFAASPQGDRRSIFHADVRLHPDDRELTGPEWAEVAHRLARAAGLQIPGSDHEGRWIAVQAQPGRLDLLANLIRADGTWTTLRRAADMSAECRRVESDLGLRSSAPGPGPGRTVGSHLPAPGLAPSISPATQLAGLLSELADEAAGPLATVRGLVEYAARRLGSLPQAHGPDSGRTLELVAVRLHDVQTDLDVIATRLHRSRQHGPATHLPAASSTTAMRRAP
ncbi:relaxase/mobilization nuclease [Streptomyces sp. NPDC056470]|uniref:relaxase/mobilization nuclease n=1 Tax=Streptomyces sp. NPDC056470 TaxID=3345831 RepID=UPI0036ABBE62